MNDTEAFYESSRCLFCYDAPCIEACPTGIDIPLFIKQIQTGNTKGAAETIYDANWLGNACGKVCPTGVLCEGACVYNHQDVPPIQIGRLQNFATDKVIQEKAALFNPGADQGKKVAIIGAGPAGIACAAELRTLGYEAQIFEAKSKPSGLTVHGVAPYKITNEEVLDEMNFIQDQLGFDIKYNNPISEDSQLKALEDEYDAVFLGVGLGPTAKRSIPGEELEGVIGAVEFIEQLREKQAELAVPARVVVIGGGNTAMDAASESARMGADEVTLVYRGDKERMGAYDFEYKLAISAGVRSIFSASPKAILGGQSVAGVTFITDDGEIDIACDMVIMATGQAKQVKLYDMIDGLSVDDGQRLVVNEEFQTTNPKYFAGGDAINGGAEVVNAAYDGKMAAHGIHNWLNNA